ncbi:hypothetical protein C8F01DRAFT_757505 [Mycena amicta]|nr:hypothetical protein C8F01DRAFT_757505 [Mycena amicta]
MGRTFLNIKVRLGCHQCDWPSRTRMFFVLPLFCSVRDAMKAWHHDHLSGHPSSCPSPSRQSSRRVCLAPSLGSACPPVRLPRPANDREGATSSRRMARGYRRLRSAIAEWATRPCLAFPLLLPTHTHAGISLPAYIHPLSHAMASNPSTPFEQYHLACRAQRRHLSTLHHPPELRRTRATFPNRMPGGGRWVEVPSSSLECVSFRSVRIHPLLPVDASPQPHCLVVILRDHRVPRHLARADTFIQST